MNNERILVVDDDLAHAEVIQTILQRSGYTVEIADHFQAAVDRVRARDFAIVITDLMLGDGSGIDLLRDINQRTPEVGVFVMTGYASAETAVTAMDEGAISYIIKPIDARELRARVDRQLAAQHLRSDNDDLHQALDQRFGLEGMVGNSQPIKEVFARIKQAAPSSAAVLISGESGTGKELVAHSLHQLSKRSRRKFVAVNCAALSASLIESELFGYVKGAFTGAQDSKIGKFEYADGGTLFLDEIGEMSIETQAKLLRVLENKEVIPVGGNKARKIDIRIVAATNKSLEDAVAAGEFREDLFYRLKVVELQVPPLRDRAGDIPLLVSHFSKEISKREDIEVPSFDHQALAHFVAYQWPGNVRELRNAVENMILFDSDGVLDIDDLPFGLADVDVSAAASEHVALGTVPKVSDAVAIEHLVGKSLAEVERLLIESTLDACADNRKKAARQLGMGERTLYRKIKEFQRD
ncbi:MAG: sigma-54-dependent Fis family transcriptional regulator [Planctomycetes bacterium]|nr:sigma-54-dependent Fis family transcriptional regulator [Planctomycetota bacterium]